MRILLEVARQNFGYQQGELKLIPPTSVLVRLNLLIALLCCSLICEEQQSVAEEDSEYHETPIDDFDRDHWSFQPILKPELPPIRRADWPRTAIDRFPSKGSIPKK